MPDVSPGAVLAATVAAFVLSATYYALLARQLAAVSDAAATDQHAPPLTIAVELIRNLLLAAVVAGLAAEAGIDESTGGLLLGLSLWIGFPFVLWTGAVIHERTPITLAALHAGDWLVKLPVVAGIVSAWQ